MALTINTKIINDADNYTADAKQIRGGYVSVATISERDNLPAATIMHGSLCYVSDEDKFYQYDGTTWIEAEFGGSQAYVVSSTTQTPFQSSEQEIEIETSFTDIAGETHLVEDLAVGETIYVHEPEYPNRWVSEVYAEEPGPGPSPLPSGYTQLLYIEATGTLYIDTKLHFVENDYIAIDLMPKANNPDNAFYGAYTSTGTCELAVLSAKFRGNLGSTTDAPDCIENTRYTVINNAGKWYINDIGFGAANNNTITALTNVIFARNTGSGVNKTSRAAVYSLIHKRNNIEIGHFVPARRNSDNVVGMYDKCNSGKNAWDDLQASVYGNMQKNDRTYTNIGTDVRTYFSATAVFYNNNTYIGSTPIGNGSITAVGKYNGIYTVPADKTITRIMIKHSGQFADLGTQLCTELKSGQQYCISLQVYSVNPSVVGGLSFGDIQIEEGPTATDYEPFPFYTNAGTGTFIAGPDVNTSNELVYKAKLRRVGKSDGKIDDVKVNNVSVVTNKVANIDLTDYVTADDGIPGSPIPINADTLNGQLPSYYSHVSVNNTGTATDTVSYITINGVEKKLAGGGSGGGTWGSITGTLSDQTDLQQVLDAKQNSLTPQTEYVNKGTAYKVPLITTNNLGQVTNINEVDIEKTTLSDLGITATSSELNVLDGITSSTTELNYTDGVTSNIQTQLNSKLGMLTPGNGISITNNTITNTGLINNATGENSVSIVGTGTSNTGSINIGNVSSVTGNNAVAIGFYSRATNNAAFALGYYTNAGQGSTALGYASTVPGNNSIGIGYSAKCNNNAQYAIAMGFNSEANAENAIQLGRGVNNTASTFNVGLSASNNYQLLDANGKIPAARLDNYHDSAKEDISNKVTTITSSSTDTQYPSAKAVWDTEQDIKEIAEGKTKSYAVSTAHNAVLNSQDASVTLTSALILQDGTTSIALSDLKKGDNIYIIETDVPDRWIAVESSSAVQCYKLETAKVPVQDVQINGTTIVTNNIATIPNAGQSVAGVIRTSSNYATNMTGSVLISKEKTYAEYQNMNGQGFVGKTTLENALDNETVRFDKATSLTDEQKDQARTNINAAQDLGFTINNDGELCITYTED